MSENIINLVNNLARMTLPEDEVNTTGLDEAAAEEKIEEHICEFDDDRLFGEYQTFMSVIRDARSLLKTGNEEVSIPDGDYLLEDDAAWFSIGDMSVRLIRQEGELTITVYEKGEEFVSDDEANHLAHISLKEPA